jgi:magnesium transporter
LCIYFSMNSGNREIWGKYHIDIIIHLIKCCLPEPYDYNISMKISWFLIASQKLQKQTTAFDQNKLVREKNVEYWIDINDAKPEEFREFLLPMNLHPLMLKRCLDQVINPGVLVNDNSVLMEYPVIFDRESDEPAYLTILLQSPVLITVRHGPTPALDELIQELTGEPDSRIDHLAQIIYLILDEFTDLNVDAEVNIRDQLFLMAKTLADNPDRFDSKSLGHIRQRVENLNSLVENQLYCISSLSALDLKDLQESHRKAYIQDLLTEAEITQRGVNRLENRVNNLYNDYQMLGSDRVEKRLRLLTIVSAITLPLGLVAGLLGMNVGGVPGINNPSGFLIVMIIMIVIALSMFVYFKNKGWFD